jgi:hypothetical protein
MDLNLVLISYLHFNILIDLLGTIYVKEWDFFLKGAWIQSNMKLLELLDLIMENKLKQLASSIQLEMDCHRLINKIRIKKNLLLLINGKMEKLISKIRSTTNLKNNFKI